MCEMPTVNSLEEAINVVIRENKMDGYNPTYFTRAVMNTENLIHTCSLFIKSQSSYSALTEAFLKHPDLLILEDFISVYGGIWGFNEEDVEKALSRVAVFDNLVKHKRYG